MPAYAIPMQFNGEQVFFEVSPCSWMHPHYGLQVSVALREGATNVESEFVLDRSIKAAELSKDQRDALAKAMVEKWLAANTTAPLHSKVKSFEAMSAKFATDREKSAKKLVERQLRRDALHKSKGYTHRVVMWIHPKRGDDYQASAYVAGIPDDKVMAKLLKASTVKTDFTVVAL